MKTIYIYRFIIILISFFSSASLVNGQVDGSSGSGNSEISDKIELTPQERAWIKDHPIIRATNKLNTAPNEFVRAGRPAGFSVDYLNLVAQNVGLEIEYVHGYTWSELLRKLKDREIDMSHNIFLNQERAVYLKFTEPYMNLEPAFFAKTGTGEINSIADLEGKRISVVKGWALNNEYKQQYPNLNFIEYETSVDAAIALSEGQVDLHISTLFIGKSLISNNFIYDIDVVGMADFLEITNNEGARLAVRNDWPILFSILQKGMGLITNEQYIELNRKWLMPRNFANDIALTNQEMKWLSENPIVKVAVDPAIMPVESIDENGEISGMAGSYLETISKKLNVNFVWAGNESFSDGIAMIKSDEADMISAASMSGDRADFLTFTEPYMQLNSVIFGREGEDIFGDLNGLDGRSVAMPAGFDITGWIRRDNPQINVIEAENKKAALQLVAQGEVDAHIGSVPITSHNLAAEKITNLTVVGVTDYTTDIAMGVRKELPLLASAIQKAIASIPEAERAQINREWIALKTEPSPDYTLVWQIVAAAAAVVFLILMWNYKLQREVGRRKTSEERFRQIAETVDGVFFICSPDLKKTRYVSPNFEKWTKRNCKQLYANNKLWLEIVHPDDRALYRQAVDRALKANFKSKLLDYRIIDGNGAVKWISTQAHPITNEQGEIISVVGFMTDITTSVNSRVKLNEISNQFQNAFTHASHGMALVSMDGKFLRVNQALCNILRYESDELLKLDVKTITHPEDVKISFTLMNEVVSGVRQSFQLEKRHVRKDGSSMPAQLNVSLVRDDKGNPVHFVAQIQDLSALKEREDQLRHSQKMDAVGELTGGIAHDFNNILGIILGNLEILKSTMPDEPKAARRLEKALKGVDRGSSLIKKLLSFSRVTPRKTGAVVINDNINNLAEFIKRTFPASVNVRTSLEQDLWPIEVDVGDLEDAVLNLALNARDAMQGDGQLDISTENVVLDNAYVQKNPDSIIGDHVVISVRDTGTGIEPALMDKILEPFFTTKPLNKGSGLGLSMVHGFVQRSKGHIRISSDHGIGATFKILIPRSTKADRVIDKNKGPMIELPKGSETILVVDDEQHLCEVATEQLENLGYSVFTANNASNALDVLSKNQQIDLLFSDIVMPDNLDGYKMASSALKLQPSLKILLTSGYSQNIERNIPAEDETISELTANMLQKPYNREQLAMAVRNSLDR